MTRPKNMMKCLIPKCRGDRVGGRGLCQTCYVKAYRQVILGNTTWEEMEKLGLATPSRQNGSSIMELIESRRVQSSITDTDEYSVCYGG